MSVLRPAPVCLAILLITTSLQPTGLAAQPADDEGDITSPASPVVDDPFYPDFGDVIDQLQDLAADHPALVDYQDIGNATHTSRDIVALKISDNVGDDEDEPVWAFTGIIHGSEQLGLRVLLDLAEELADEYGADSDVTDWVDAYEIWVVLLLNPWGYDHDSSGGSKVTGTRRNGASSTDPDTSGVDLARNYDFRWGQGGSTDPEDSRYRGPEAFSEAETQSIRDFFVAHRPIFGITFHQGNDPDGGEIMRPWSGSGSDAPPDATRLTEYANLYADWVFASRSGGAFCDFSLEDPDGDGHCTNEGDHEYCDELCWEPDQATLGRYGQPSNWYYHEVGTFDYTVELSDRTFNGSFMHEAAGPGDTDEQAYKDIATEFARNHIDAIKDWFEYFLHNTAEPYEFTGPGLTGHVTDDLLGFPLAATIEVSGYTSSLIEDRTSDSEFGRYWRLLPAGTHSVTVSKPGYDPWSDSVPVGSGALTEVDVTLVPHLDIALPNSTYVAWVGEPDNPRAFTVRLILGSPGEPCVGPLPFSVSVRDETSAWIEANTGVQACVQDNYWISVQAPDIGDGTFVTDGVYDLKVELDTVSGESSSAIRYTDREEDTIFVMDVSGSMGSGGKLEAAQEAAMLLVNELADNDQGALVWFSGDGSEPNRDADTDYELDAMTLGNQIALISAISGLSLENLTSIGDGLQEALDESESERADPDHYCGLVLLSDGMENEPDYWVDVQPRVEESPCLIHVVALGPETDELLLQDINQKGTADPSDDGSYTYATINDPSASASGVESVSAHWPNKLAGIYDDIAARLAQRQRLFKVLGSVGRTLDEHLIHVDDTIDEAVFALKWSGMDDAGRLDLKDPGGTLIVSTMPTVTMHSSSTNQVSRVLDPQIEKLPYILVASGQTSIEFQVYTSADVDRVHQGEAVHILGLLTESGQPVTGADVRVTVEAADGVSNTLRLYDDGVHDDGSADDGFYASVYDRIVAGDRIHPARPELDGFRVRGSYTWEATAQTPSFQRIASGGFAATPSPDSDQDGMPDPWEKAHGLDPLDPHDALADPDLDGLPNLGEFQAGTDPHDSDTDEGGEGDGSEVSHGRDPLWPADDTIVPVVDFDVSPLPNGASITWTSQPGHASFQLWRRGPGSGWQLIPLVGPSRAAQQPSHTYEDSGLENGVMYEYLLAALGSHGQSSGNSPTLAVTPVADPYPPQGKVLINDGAEVAPSRQVTLTIQADRDTTEMRLGSEIDEGTDEIGGPWRPFQTPLPWLIPVEIGPGETWTIYAQFRDAAGNESDVATDSIQRQPLL
ncbi:MAG: M14 family zinc carboxypeptidase, partial [Anaerolineae bacterium]